MGNLAVKDGASLEYDGATLGRVVESLVVRGDVSALNPEEKARFYVQMCGQLGLNAATQPLAVLKLNGKEIFYPTRGATDQLAAIHRLTREIVDGPRVVDLAGTKLVYAVCKATHPNGRVETAVATVPLTDPANVLMKCETKAKRRATLSILGLGMLDESELDTIPASAKEPAPAIDLGVLDAKENEPQAALVAVTPEIPEARLKLDARLLLAKTLPEVVQVWVSLRGEFEDNSPQKQSAWSACITAAAAILKTDNRKAVNTALAAEVRRWDELNPPPRGPSVEGHRTAPVTNAEGKAEAATIAAEGSNARAWIERAIAGEHGCITHLVRSWLAHKDEFGPDFEDAETAFRAAAKTHYGYREKSLNTLVELESKARSKRLQTARKAHLKLVQRAA